MVSFADFPLLTLFENPVRGPRWKLKRAVDIVIAVVTLVLLSPLLVGIAAAIRLTSDGEILFRQERTSMDRKRIEVLKFRTMEAGAPESMHRDFMKAMLAGASDVTASDTGFYKLTDDPRITRVGRFLRRFSLDELPQLFNVLRGDMSVVGPRPAIPYEVELYEELAAPTIRRPAGHDRALAGERTFPPHPGRHAPTRRALRGDVVAAKGLPDYATDDPGGAAGRRALTLRCNRDLVCWCWSRPRRCPRVCP